MEFARVASSRGHKVTLFEKEEELGGRFRVAAIAPKKGELNEFVEYLSRSLRELGVEIKTGVSIKAEELANLDDFDEIVIAAGGDPIRIPVADAQANVAVAEEVLQNKIPLGSKIVVVGGGMVGCETADWIAQNGKQVVIVEQLAQVAHQPGCRCQHRQPRSLDAEPLVPVEGGGATVGRRENGELFWGQPAEQLVEVRLDPAELGREIVGDEQAAHQPDTSGATAR